MRDQRQSFFASAMLISGLFIAAACAPVASAGEEPADLQTTPIPASEAEADLMTGPQVYSAVCIACHAPPGIGGAPALGDSEAWAPRLDQGAETLIDHALHGYSGETGLMPMKGGRLDLADEEVIRAVEYMIELAE